MDARARKEPCLSCRFRLINILMEFVYILEIFDYIFGTSICYSGVKEAKVMRHSKITMLIIVIVGLLTLTACRSGGQEGRITVIDGTRPQAGEPAVTVETIDQYENIEINDWLDEDTILVSKENETLSKLSLEELSDSHPRSLYWFHLDTGQYELLIERENANVGSARLSPGKKHMIYEEYMLGDPVIHVMNLGTKETFRLSGEPIAGAISAKWADDETIIGAAYSGTAYTAKVSGEMISLDHISEDALFIVVQMKNKIYFNTNADSSLRAIDLETMETTRLDLDHVSGVFPSPDNNQLLIVQHNGSRISLSLSDDTGENRTVIAEGTELDGVSWSPDQRLIAYTLKDDSGNGAVKTLYLYDILTGESNQIAVNIANAVTVWNPSSSALAYTEWNGDQYRSSIVRLRYSLQKDE